MPVETSRLSHYGSNELMKVRPMTSDGIRASPPRARHEINHARTSAFPGSVVREEQDVVTQTDFAGLGLGALQAVEQTSNRSEKSRFIRVGRDEIRESSPAGQASATTGRYTSWTFEA